MNLFRRMIDRFLTHFINFLIDLRDIVDTSPNVFYDTIKKWKETQICPWCDGTGLLTKDGRSLQEGDDE